MTTEKHTMSFEEVFSEMRKMGMKAPMSSVRIKVPNARTMLYAGLKSVIGENAVWLPEYEKVAEWLTDNKGRGLFMFGNCGRGKSLLGRYVLPAIILSCCQKVVNVFDMQDLNANLDLALKKHLVSLDDVGTEEMAVKYGERRMAFPEIMDAAEKCGKLVIVSTNLGESELRERYGDRILDRIKALTFRVCFNGESLRK